MTKTIKQWARLVAIFLSMPVLLAVGYTLYLTSPTHIRTEHSPDGKYKMDIYEEPMLFAMPGGGSDNYATLILRHANGEFIGEVNGDSGNCAVMLRDVEVFWIDEWAYYVRSGAINVNTGKQGQCNICLVIDRS